MAWIYLSRAILPLLIVNICWALISITASSGAMLFSCTLLQIWPLVGRIGGRKSKSQIMIETLNPNVPGIRSESGLDFSKVDKQLKK
jgi:hypothetical protein